ncbi:hypothetical protein ACFWVB_19995 [Streptomyces microflavus]|uniref:hypothetical protein n=1 Tax=Streptomyces microflavus TaxID=1919 RepID=UPI003655F780
MASAAQRAWDELNDRQRTYLGVLYDEDQGLEAEHRHNAATGRFSRAPASVWRRINMTGINASVPRALRSRKVWESGAGSTLAALDERGLIDRGFSVETGSSYVLLTRAGRAAVRFGRGIGPTPRKEPWELSEWLWREMAKVARTGTEGLPTRELFGSAHLYLEEGRSTPGNRPYLKVVSTWVEYTPRDFNGNLSPYTSKQQVRRYHFTEEGRAHYLEHAPQYREFYPDIEAPDVPATAEPTA